MSNCVTPYPAPIYGTNSGLLVSGKGAGHSTAPLLRLAVRSGCRQRRRDKGTKVCLALFLQILESSEARHRKRRPPLLLSPTLL